jgi:putative NADH-flavin reductase
MIMKIAILGSTGFVGRVLLEKALENGIQIKTLVRNPERLNDFKTGVEFVQGDISQFEKVNECVMGAQAVLSTVPPERNTREPEKYALIMKELVNILEKNGIKRFIHIGGAVHGGGENENWTFERRLLRIFLNLMWKPGLIAKQLEWEILQKSELDWTLIRPPRIGRRKSKGEIIADEKNLASLEINVEDLAEFMLKQIESIEWIRKAPLVAIKKY